MKPFLIKIPATTANLGPGYDTLGLALDIYNHFEFHPLPPGKLSIEVHGEGAQEIPRNKNNLVYRSFLSLFNDLNEKPVPGLKIFQHNNIPANRGMGSSATAIIAGLIAARELSKVEIDDETLMEKAVSLEGHPDNVMAAFMGGAVICFTVGGRPRGEKFILPAPLQIVLSVPDIQISTAKAREILPRSYDSGDVVFNLRNLSLLTYAFAKGRYELLSHAMKDRIHQPYRGKLIPGFFRIVEKAEEAGALGTAISGSGSTVISFCRENAEEIGQLMKEVFAENGVRCRTIITAPAENGAGIEYIG